VPEPNAPALANTPDDAPLSNPTLTSDPENTEPLALKPEATAIVPELTPTPTPDETPLAMVVPLVTREPLDVTIVPEPEPFPLPEGPKSSRLVRAPHPVSRSKSDAPIAARNFDICPPFLPSMPQERGPARESGEMTIAHAMAGPSRRSI
jgi:hypothetical protein